MIRIILATILVVALTFPNISEAKSRKYPMYCGAYLLELPTPEGGRATIAMGGGYRTIQIDPNLRGDLRKVVLLHECAHMKYNTTDEKFADCYALKRAGRAPSLLRAMARRFGNYRVQQYINSCGD